MTIPYLPHPKNWETHTLEPNKEDDFIISVFSGGTPSTSVSDYWDGDIPWLTPKDITNINGDFFIAKSERSITANGLKNSGAKLCPVKTVMLTKRAPVGISIINSVPMATNQGFLNFICGKALDPLYLCLWFRCNTSYLDAIANGSTYPELYGSDLFEIEISVPKIEEQRKISDFVFSLDTCIRLGNVVEGSSSHLSESLEIRNETNELRRFKEIIMPKLLSGEIKVEKLQNTHS